MQKDLPACWIIKQPPAIFPFSISDLNPFETRTQKAGWGCEKRWNIQRQRPQVGREQLQEKVDIETEEDGEKNDLLEFHKGLKDLSMSVLAGGMGFEEAQRMKPWLRKAKPKPDHTSCLTKSGALYLLILNRVILVTWSVIHPLWLIYGPLSYMNPEFIQYSMKSKVQLLILSLESTVLKNHLNSCGKAHTNYWCLSILPNMTISLLHWHYKSQNSMLSRYL